MSPTAESVHANKKITMSNTFRKLQEEGEGSKVLEEERQKIADNIGQSSKLS